MTERKALLKKIRFEVFKRDSFTCQYCGRAAPDVLLEVDHIKPVSKDGDNDITNLITSCFDCNHGKSDRELSDDAVVLKRKAQLDKLQERREQIEMMMEWRGSLDNIQSLELEQLVKYIDDKIYPFSINDNGIKKIKSSLRKYGLSEMLESVNISSAQYIDSAHGKQVFEASVFKCVDYIHRIAKSRDTIRKKPYMEDLYRIKGLLKYKFSVDYEAMNLMEEAYLKGVEISDIEIISRRNEDYWDWVTELQEAIDAKV